MKGVRCLVMREAGRRLEESVNEEQKTTQMWEQKPRVGGPAAYITRTCAPSLRDVRVANIQHKETCSQSMHIEKEMRALKRKRDALKEPWSWGTRCACAPP